MYRFYSDTGLLGEIQNEQSDNRKMPDMRETPHQILPQHKKQKAGRKGVLQEPQHKNSIDGGQMASTESAEQLRPDKHELEGGEEKNESGLCICPRTTEPSHQRKEKRGQTVHSRTQAEHGEASGQIFGELGEGTPQKRREGRQQNRESDAGEYEYTYGESTMSPLSQVVLDPLTCPKCGSSDLEQVDCQHVWGDEVLRKMSGGIGTGIVGSHQDDRTHFSAAGQFCQLCGCWRGCLGLEPDPECVPMDTECLTLNGWKQYHELSVGEPIVVYDLNRDEARLECLLAKASFHYAGKMVAVTNQGLDILTTPNHRFVVNSVVDSKSRRVIRFRLASELSQNDFVVALPKHFSVGPVFNWSREFTELLGWIISDGSMKGGGGIKILQSHRVKQKNVDRIRCLLQQLEIPFRERRQEDRGMTIFTIGKLTEPIRSRSPQVMAEYRNEWFHRITQIIPNCNMTLDLVYRTSAEAAEGLLAGLIGGDGTTRNGKYISFAQKDKTCMDLFQILAMRCGYRATVAEPRKSGGCYVATLSRKRRIGLTWVVEKRFVREPSTYIDWEGEVWCPQVSTGAWVARRNGKVFITGNSYISHLVSIFRCVRRVLRDDGLLFVNIGSSYIGNEIESSEMVLRDDLTSEEIEYVYRELAKNATKP